MSAFPDLQRRSARLNNSSLVACEVASSSAPHDGHSSSNPSPNANSSTQASNSAASSFCPMTQSYQTRANEHRRSAERLPRAVRAAGRMRCDTRSISRPRSSRATSRGSIVTSAHELRRGPLGEASPGTLARTLRAIRSRRMSTVFGSVDGCRREAEPGRPPLGRRLVCNTQALVRAQRLCTSRPPDTRTVLRTFRSTQRRKQPSAQLWWSRSMDRESRRSRTWSHSSCRARSRSVECARAALTTPSRELADVAG